MKIWSFSDTHRKHAFLDIPPDVDMAIFAGDATNDKIPAINANELLDFLEFFRSLTHIKYKIFTGGNHDTSLEQGLVRISENDPDLIYLNHTGANIEGINIFGSPYTPHFGSNWAWNVPRGSLTPFWNEIPENTDILITHGPPKGILDLTQYDTRSGANGNSYFQCGCKELLDRVKIIQPKYHIFGHIHPEVNCPNAGILKINNCQTTFINAAVCDFGRTPEDEKVKQLINNGFIFEY